MISPSAAALALLAAQVWPVEAPPVTFPALVERAATAQGFVPAGWTLADSKSGDLNADGTADHALLLRMTDKANIIPITNGGEGETWDTNPFMIAVAFADPAGGYRLALANHQALERPDVPFSGNPMPDALTLTIDKGALIVFYEYLRDHESIRFRWDGGRFRLIGYDSGGASGACVETLSVNYLTGKARWTIEPISGGKRSATSAAVVPTYLPTLETFDKNVFIATDTVDAPAPRCES